MKTIFIVNPKAGQGKTTNQLIDSIKKIISEKNADAQIYITCGVGDAERFVRNYCTEHGGVRFIACGGDGTLSEVINGAMECPESEVGVVPIGTGNDFCRNFDGECDFSDIALQLDGNTQKCDLIRYTGKINGVKKSGYCANMVNIGFDCNVADMTSDMKKKPFISGSVAYLVSIFVMLIQKRGARLCISLDDEVVHSGYLLLSAIANGSYCGGGIMSNPLAKVSDGEININMVKNVSRSKFIRLFPYYKNGTVLKLNGIDKYILSRNCKKVTVTPLDGETRICIDGEIMTSEKIEFEIVPSAMSFVLPKKLTKTEEDSFEVDRV